MSTRIFPAMVIVEGPRGVGKTTALDLVERYLIQARQEPVRFKAERGEDPTTDMLETIMRIVNASYHFPTRVLLVDRFHITELALRLADETRSTKELVRDTSIIQQILISEKFPTFLLYCQEEERQRRVSLRDDGRPDLTPTQQSIWQAVVGSNLRAAITNHYVDLIDVTAISPRLTAKTLMYRMRAAVELKIN